MIYLYNLLSSEDCQRSSHRGIRTTFCFFTLSVIGSFAPGRRCEAEKLCQANVRHWPSRHGTFLRIAGVKRVVEVESSLPSGHVVRADCRTAWANIFGLFFVVSPIQSFAPFFFCRQGRVYLAQVQLGSQSKQLPSPRWHCWTSSVRSWH